MKQGLIIEDRPEIAILYKRALLAIDYEVHVAFDLQSGYVILRKVPPPDLVLLDLNLSAKENANHTVQQISYIKSFNPDMILLVISGVLTPELIATALEQGADNIKEKLDMLSQVDLWKTIQASLDQAPTSVKEKMSHQVELLKKFARHFNLL